MKISLSPATPEAWSGSVLALGIVENDPQGLVATMEQRFSLQLADWLKQKPFSGKPGDCVSLPLLRGDCTTLVLVGLGAADDVDRDGLRLAAAAAAGAAIGQVGTLGLLLPWSNETPEEDAAAAAEARARPSRLARCARPGGAPARARSHTNSLPRPDDASMRVRAHAGATARFYLFL